MVPVIQMKNASPLLRSSVMRFNLELKTSAVNMALLEKPGY